MHPATSLTFLVPSYTGCTATIAINGSSPVTACATKSSNGVDVPFSINNLPAGTHQVQWNTGVISGGAEVIFSGITGGRQTEASEMTNVTVDDAYAGTGSIGLSYTGEWTHLDQSSKLDTSEVGTLANNFNKTLAITQTLGAAVTFSGAGQSIWTILPMTDFGRIRDLPIWIGRTGLRLRFGVAR